MTQMHSLAFILAMTPVFATAQRLDGCTVSQHSVSQGVPLDIQEKTLKDAGYTLDRTAMVPALNAAMADIRSFAARELFHVGRPPDLLPMMRAWMDEKDECAKWALQSSMWSLAGKFRDGNEPTPDARWRVTPFQACSATAPARISLSIVQVAVAGYSKPAVQILVQNLTQDPLPFLWDPSAAAIFSVTVLTPTGQRAQITKGEEWMYEPPDFEHSYGHGPAFAPLIPGKAFSWNWRAGDDFDMSAPGTYQVSFGGKLNYLDTTVCTNTAEVVVE